MSIYAKALDRAAIPGEYRQRYTEPPKLGCMKCRKRPAPDIHIEDMGWMSLGLCDGCQAYAERIEGTMQEGMERDAIARRLHGRMEAAGLTTVDLSLDYTLDPLWRGFRRPEQNTGLEPRPWGAFVWGPTGTGKSTELALAVRRYVADGWNCRLVSQAELLDTLRPDGGMRVRDYAALDLLAIDELGRDSLTAWSREQLQEILDARMGSRFRKPTMLASNLDLKALMTRVETLRDGTRREMPGLGRRTIERIAVACGYTPERDPTHKVARTYSYRLGREMGKAA